MSPGSQENLPIKGSYTSTKPSVWAPYYLVSCILIMYGKGIFVCLQVLILTMQLTRWLQNTEVNFPVPLIAQCSRLKRLFWKLSVNLLLCLQHPGEDSWGDHLRGPLIDTYFVYVALALQITQYNTWTFLSRHRHMDRVASLSGPVNYP